MFVNLFFSFISLIVFLRLSDGLTKMNGKGVNARKTYLALKKFIKTQPLTEGRLFDTYLPYAIALGVQKKWVKKAEQIGYDSSNSSWHSSNITTAGFIGLSYGLNNSVRSAVSASGAGGGFGGGGGAGGGGGGAG